MWDHYLLITISSERKAKKCQRNPFTVNCRQPFSPSQPDCTRWRVGCNRRVNLAANYTPEFDSFKERLLELAQIRSVDELLRRVVTRLAERPHVALARIWIVDKGDVCASCPMRAKCPDRTTCLHLVASAGRPQADPKADWSRLDDEFRRIPIGVGQIGRVAATGQALVVKDGDRNPSLLPRPDWAAAAEIQGFDAQPIWHNDEVLGVLTLHTHSHARPRPGLAAHFCRPHRGGARECARVRGERTAPRPAGVGSRLSPGRSPRSQGPGRDHWPERQPPAVTAAD